MIGMHGVGPEGEHGVWESWLWRPFWRFMYGIGLNGNEVTMSVCRDIQSLSMKLSMNAWLCFCECVVSSLDVLIACIYEFTCSTWAI
jgi:hypothetical protein